MMPQNIVFFKRILSENTTKKNNGSSPYAEKYKEGPSYQPSTLYLEPSGDLDREYEFDEITHR